MSSASNPAVFEVDMAMLPEDHIKRRRIEAAAENYEAAALDVLCEEEFGWSLEQAPVHATSCEDLHDDLHDDEDACLGSLSESREPDISCGYGVSASQAVQPTAQPMCSASERASFVDWQVGVHMRYKLKPETLFLAVSIADRYLATRKVESKKLQLVFCAALFIAAKFEELEPPELRDFVFVLDSGFTKESMLDMELRMLSTLQFCLCQPTSFQRLDRYMPDRLRHHPQGASLVQYVLELALLDLKLMRFSPSLQAAAAALVSCRMLGLEDADDVLVGQSAKMVQALHRCADDMFALLRAASAYAPGVMQKFSKPEFRGVATMSMSAVGV